MIKELAEFFKDKNIDMEQHQYGAHVKRPYSVLQIENKFKSYKAMIEAVKAEIEASKPRPRRRPKGKTCLTK